MLGGCSSGTKFLFCPASLGRFFFLNGASALWRISSLPKNQFLRAPLLSVRSSFSLSDKSFATSACFHRCGFSFPKCMRFLVALSLSQLPFFLSAVVCTTTARIFISALPFSPLLGPHELSHSTYALPFSLALLWLMLRAFHDSFHFHFSDTMHAFLSH